MPKSHETENDNAYTRNGYDGRDDYINSLADNYGVDSYAVRMLSEIMGESEDFDGLVSELEDMDCCGALDAFRTDDSDEEA
jgi:hypothetical protein